MYERVVFTGGDGMIGREMKKIMPDAIYLRHSDMDITDEVQVRRVLGALKPDLVVHLAAMTLLEPCEKNKDTAYKVNVEGTRNVALNSPNLLYMCTDYIHDGKRGNYSETDTPSPQSYYAQTKYWGSLEARKCPGKSVVVITSCKPRPYKHPKVPRGMYSTGGYVDDMAKEYKFAIDHFGILPRTINIGIRKRLLSELARETRAITLMDIDQVPVGIPLDSSLDLTMWRRIKERYA